MSPRLRRVLHRPFDLLADPRHAAGQTGRGALCSVDRRQSVQAVRAAGAAGGVCGAAAERGDVRGVGRGGDNLFERAGAAHPNLKLVDGGIIYSKGVG